MRRKAWIFLAVSAVLLAAPGLARSEQRARDPAVANGVEPEVVDEPAFPGVFLRDRVRVWTGTSFAPSADFGSVDLSLIRPELRFRGRVPVGESLSFQLVADFRASHYDLDGAGPLFEDCSNCPNPGDFYAASLGAQGGYLLNHGWSLFRDDEQWALLGALYTSARWETGAFEKSVSPGISIGLGYQIPDTLRIALAARVERALDGDGVSVGPSGYLRWNFAPNFQLRNRGLGLQVEYRPASRWEVFVAGFRASDSFRLDRRPGAPSGMTFRDRQVTVGGGLVFKLHRSVRFSAEGAAIVDRRVSVNSRDDGRLDSVDGDVSPYFAFRIELRP